MIDRDAEAAQAVVAEIIVAGGRALAVSVDLRDTARAKSTVAQAVAGLGRLDFVWNHLGHPGPGRVEGMAQADFDQAVDLSLRSVIETTEAANPELRKSGSAAILYTASTGGLVRSRFWSGRAIAWFIPQ